jgi:hypothetical protein
MKTSVFTAAIAAAGVLFCVGSANAQNNQSFVSASLGSDTNKCTRADPCRNFTKALSVTNANGEITVLDSGGYAPFTINKAIYILAPAGVYAEIIAASGNGITITASGIVSLNGLTISGLGSGSIGVDVTSSSAAFDLLNCGVIGFTTQGVATNGGALVVENSIIANGLGPQTGTAILVNGGAAMIRGSQVLGGTTGISAGGATTINDSFLSNDGTAISNAAGVAVTIERNQITFNGTGLSVNSTNGGAIYSFGDNDVSFNTTNVSGSLTPISKM